MLNDKPNIETKLTLVGLVIFLFLGVLVFFMVGAKGAFPPRTLIIIVLIALLLVGAGTFYYRNRSSEKAKRSLDGLDTYKFIDALLDDLSRDEFNYLKRLVDNTYCEEEEPLSYDATEDDLQANPIYQSQ
jgi:hypothetical protein